MPETDPLCAASSKALSGGATHAPAVDFGIIRYANCWEDAEVLARALAPALGRRVLAIASGLDNCLWLAAAGAEVTACDLSSAQLALGHLKLAALRRLDDDELEAFVGLRPCRHRLALLRRLWGDLPVEARAFWRGNLPAVARGLVHAGRFERYFQIFRRAVLPLVHSRRCIEALLRVRTPAALRRFYDHRWDGWRWQALFRVFFSQPVMGRLGRDPAFFDQVEGPVAAQILARGKAALTGDLPRNHFLRYILAGGFSDTCRPPWLRRAHRAAVRAAAGRITLVQGAIDAVAAADRAGFDGFNLSDIFEYLPLEVCDAVYGRLLDAARPGARLAYWNMQVPRRMAPRHPGRARPLEDLAQALRRDDLGFFYRDFVVEEALG